MKSGGIFIFLTTAGLSLRNLSTKFYSRCKDMADAKSIWVISGTYRLLGNSRNFFFQTIISPKTSGNESVSSQSCVRAAVLGSFSQTLPRRQGKDVTPQVNCSSLLASGSFSRVAYHLEGFFSGDSKVKNRPANSRDAGLISGLERYPGGGNSNPLQYSCLENPMDRGAWQATVHGVAKSRTRLSD